MLFFDAHYSQLAASLAKSPSSSLPTWTKTPFAIEAKVYPPAIAVGKFLCHLSLICIPNWGYRISPDLTPTVASSATAEYWVWRTWSCWSTKSKELAQLSVTTAKLTLCDSLPSIAVVGGQEFGFWYTGLLCVHLFPCELGITKLPIGSLLPYKFHKEKIHHAASNGMRTLRRYKEGLFNSSTAQIYYRKFSAIGNAKADRPRDQECLVWLGTS
ncbi:uncharacterized protein LOC133739993 isoform X3 [Rosa rugosa]|uniref:uncharacterized protein LOC133739993 isoform X3 n=1 Tax=Rosa rugosa TaxID=74645 RepID=UPI002B40C63C|nr:uncharacterized protein LOC133739993 isoform X3 [Rosa rugosa]